MKHQLPRLTAEEFESRIWGFVVILVALILAGIVFALLYSVTFVTQPIKSMAPIDIAYTKMLNDIVLLIVGGIGGVMSKKGVQAVSHAIATPSTPTVVSSPISPYAPPVAVNTNWMGFVNPELDETWVPGPPPTTPPEQLESEDDRVQLANARAEPK